jgi:hypothetical protein
VQSLTVLASIGIDQITLSCRESIVAGCALAKNINLFRVDSKECFCDLEVNVVDIAVEGIKSGDLTISVLVANPTKTTLAPAKDSQGRRGPQVQASARTGQRMTTLKAAITRDIFMV